MAESALTPEQSARLKAVESGRTGRTNMARVSGYSNPKRDAELAASARQSSQQAESRTHNRRDDNSSGGREAQERGDAGDRKLPDSPASNPSTFSPDGNILKAIADRFNSLREDSRTGAWRQFQKDLMDASPFICPHIIPYKDLISVVADIEKEIKGSSNVIGKTNEELLSEFLNGGGSITVAEDVSVGATDSPTPT